MLVRPASGPLEVMDQIRLLDMLKQSGDHHLGQTLVRLARLAEAAHRFEVAQDIHRKDQRPVHKARAFDQVEQRRGSDRCMRKVGS